MHYYTCFINLHCIKTLDENICSFLRISKKCNMRFLIFIFIIFTLVESSNILWSLCTKNHLKWMKHKPKKFNFIKAWFKSIYMRNNQCPAQEFKVLSYFYEETDNYESHYGIELVTRIDDKTGKIHFFYKYRP